MIKKQFIFLILLFIFSISLSSASVSSNVWNNVSYSDYNVTDAEYVVGENADRLDIYLGGVGNGDIYQESDIVTIINGTNPFYMPMDNSTDVVSDYVGDVTNGNFSDSVLYLDGDGNIKMQFPSDTNVTQQYIAGHIFYESSVNRQTIITDGYSSTSIDHGYILYIEPDGRLSYFDPIDNAFYYSTNYLSTGRHFIEFLRNETVGTFSIDGRDNDINFVSSYVTQDNKITIGFHSTSIGRYLYSDIIDLYMCNGDFNESNRNALITLHSGTSIKYGEIGEWQPIINGSVSLYNVTAGETIYILSASDSTIATPVTFSSLLDTTDTIISENYDGYNVTINATSYTEFPITNGTLTITTNQSVLCGENLTTNNPNATLMGTGCSGNFIIDTGYVPADATYYYLVSGVYSLPAPINLQVTEDTDHAHLEWLAVPDADNYSIALPLAEFYYANWTELGVPAPTVDGVLDEDVANISQKGVMRSPNPVSLISYDWLYGMHGDTYLHMAANTTDNDVATNDDSVGIYFDFNQDGLTTDDIGYIMTESDQFTRVKWSGSAWIAYGGSGAIHAVGGAGTSNVVYEIRIPLSEIPGYVMGTYTDLVVRRTNTDGATVYSYFPDNSAYSITDTTGWKSVYIDDTIDFDIEYEFFTTNDFYNLTGLSEFNWYNVGVAGMCCNVTGEYSYVEFVTLDYPTYTISGTVYDVDTLLPIQNSVVTITNSFTSAFTVTDSNGNYTLDNLHNDDYTVVASKNGYFDNFTFATVSDDNVTNTNIYLNNEPYATDEQIYLPWQIYGTMFGFTILMTLYAFLHRDFENYTHVLAALVSGGVNFLLGNATFIGIVFIESDLYYYSSEIWGRFHIIWGGINILLVVIFIMDLARRSQLEKEVKDEFELTGGR